MKPLTLLSMAGIGLLLGSAVTSLFQGDIDNALRALGIALAFISVSYRADKIEEKLSEKA